MAVRGKKFFPNSKIFQLSKILLCCSFASVAIAGGAPVCERVIEQASHKSSSDFKKSLEASFPSCAVWLAKTCLSPFRLDQKSSLADLSSKQKNIGEEPCTQTAEQEAAGIFPCESKGAQVFNGVSGKGLRAAIESVKSVSDKDGPSAHQRQIANLAIVQWKANNLKREQDLTTLLSYFDSESLDKNMSDGDVHAAITTLEERVKSAAGRAGSGNPVEWQKFVAQQISEAGPDRVIKWMDSQGNLQSDVEQGYYNLLADLPSDESRFHELTSRAQKTDTGQPEDFPGALTPYHSKMILLYHLENRLKAKYKNDPVKAESILNELGLKLNLKADFTSKGSQTQWKWVIPHDGFVLGANMSQIGNFMLKSGKPDQQSGVGTGIDCATFVQKILIQAGYTSLANTGRLTSARVASGEALKSFSTLEKMSIGAINNLKPGDLVIEREKKDPIGHVQIVVGYEGDPPQLVVVSAEGGFQRSLIKRRLNVFAEQPDKCSNPNYFSNNPDNVYYRASLVQGPK